MSRLRKFLLAALASVLASSGLAASAGASAAAPGAEVLPAAALAATLDHARSLDRLHALVVARNSDIVVEERFRGPALDQPVNIKSVSKSIVSALVGRAIDEGLIEGPDQRVAELIPEALPDDPDPRLQTLTVGNLLSMQAGLERTSGGNYARWIASPNWVRFALSRPFVDDPGAGMLYSTGNTHVLSAILTKVSGKSTRELFRDWIAEPLDISVGAWERDPQGIYLGGNNMALSPYGLLRFGEMIRNGGRSAEAQLIPPEWIEAMWTPRTRSIYSGEAYGYGWFITSMGGHDVFYGWGFGGQMLYIVPDLGLTVVMTSDIDTPAGRTGYVDELHRLMSERIIPAAEAASG